MNKNKSETSDLSAPNRTSPIKYSSSDDIEVRNHVDDDGYRVIELHSPNTHIEIRYNSDKNHIEFMINSHMKYFGPINRNMNIGDVTKDSLSYLDSSYNFEAVLLNALEDILFCGSIYQMLLI